MGHTRLKGASSAAPDRTGKGFLLFIIHPPRFRLWSRYTCNTWVYTPGAALTFPSVSVMCVYVYVYTLHAAVRVMRYETKLFKRNLNFHYGFNLYFTRRIGSRDKCDIIYECACVCVCVMRARRNWVKTNVNIRRILIFKSGVSQPIRD